MLDAQEEVEARGDLVSLHARIAHLQSASIDSEMSINGSNGRRSIDINRSALKRFSHLSTAHDERLDQHSLRADARRHFEGAVLSRLGSAERPARQGSRAAGG